MNIIIGVDEAGRGPLAGPVTVAAVILKKVIKGLNDSKKLSEKKRFELEPQIIKNAIDFAVVHVSVATIEQINILQASLLGMQQAVGKIAEISAASILAKNARDRLMHELDEEFPQYGFAQHKGYGTKYHLQQLQIHGPCVHHRKTYAPIQKLLQMELFK